ncbi:hypothetical protein ACFFF5_05130 [Lederbergia wuyishanensis]|uniref:Uncharacterized protein n=1 Tax=Lederbergia wuyishanensis TaxID=1347903 RepID=A0ABU0CZ18_9BACI|nr:hypothetical protein [Lederbergia wuyishanensis]MCJ8006035.1 hypothetical protein [Lederbergia wuyishanensis]MDQ0341402.1 hypothetical protein [Lederbergia wuyishanensis]
MENHHKKRHHFEGQMIRFRSENGDWRIGKVVKVRDDGLEISELDSNSYGGYGFGFFGGPFFRPPIFVPFVGFGFFEFFFL